MQPPTDMSAGLASPHPSARPVGAACASRPTPTISVSRQVNDASLPALRDVEAIAEPYLWRISRATEIHCATYLIAPLAHGYTVRTRRELPAPPRATRRPIRKSS